MTFSELKRLLRELDPESQDRVAAFLALLRQRRDPEHRRLIRSRLDDLDPNHWLTLEQVRSRL